MYNSIANLSKEERHRILSGYVRRMSEKYASEPDSPEDLARDARKKDLLRQLREKYPRS